MYIVNTKIIPNLYTDIKPNGRNFIPNMQKMVDTINSFIFDKIINTYENIKNRSNATTRDNYGEKVRISGQPLLAVQKISQLIAKKTLELTGYYNKDSITNNDLKMQVQLIKGVSDNGTGYTTIDEKLLDYFKTKYTNPENPDPKFKSGDEAIIFLKDELRLCSKDKNCRAINNAIQNDDLKEAFKKVFVCPTSSVCDAMGNFGSCVPPTNKEYFNMDFVISFNGDNGNFYQGSTNIKENESFVNVNYGFKFNDLELYNFLDIYLNNPIILQANYTFKGVINRIIDIWKAAQNVTNGEELWTILENTDYFLSILKLGSQKAVGDIFQEINSTLKNGGYNVNTLIDNKKTFGLMGDRPSGIRVIKLLKDAASDVNKNACGGYIATNINNNLVYISDSTIPLDNKRKNKKGGKTKKNKRNKKNKKSKKPKKIIQNKTKKNKKIPKNKKSIKI